ncbi:MAG: hypothetical protein B0D92_03330 [Spirochaeta sp. LUC14_002_19_P3]|nr:MAG: hypothetical protein B0D92_03330 [Spirochaeta sp. LUC14_002_19_P3]
MSGSGFIAWRLFLRGHRERRQSKPLFGAALGIALSLIPLIVVDHFADAMIEGIIARYRETSSYHFQIRTWEEPLQEEWQTLANKIAAQPGVATAWVERSGYALARARGPRDGLTLRALPENAPLRDTEFGRYIEFDEGSWNLADKSILLGREAARRLEASVGDKIFILTAATTAGNITPKVNPMTVKGIFTTGYQDLDRTWAFISLDEGWNMLAETSSTTFVGGKFTSLAQSSAIWTQIKNTLAPRWKAYSWRELNRYLLSNLESTRSILLVIMGLIIIIAVLNVLTSMVMLTLEHRREIGTLKCTGTSPGTISLAFTAAGTLAALIGILFGLAAGLLMSYHINSIIASIEYTLTLINGIFTDAPPPVLLSEGYYLQEVPVKMRWLVTSVIGIITLILSIGAAWLPASRAAGLKPLEVLRKH